MKERKLKPELSQIIDGQGQKPFSINALLEERLFVLKQCVNAQPGLHIIDAPLMGVG
jgi:hypothetical protein